MSRADHDIRLNLDQMTGLFTATAIGQRFAIGVDSTAPGHETGSATLLEGVGDLWHACGDSFDAVSLPGLAKAVAAAKTMLGQCGKPQGSHKGAHGYVFRAAAPVLADLAPMPLAGLAAISPYAVQQPPFAIVPGARSEEDRHILLGLMIERAGTLSPMARFGSEWIDDLVEITTAITGR